MSKLDTIYALLKQADDDIRKGDSKSARTIALQLVPSVGLLNSRAKISLGNILRRSGLYKLSAKVLFPLVRGEKMAIDDLSGQAIIEYSGALNQMGLVSEARELLIPLQSQPQALLQIGLSYFQEWDHESAIPFLEKIVSKNKDISEYELLVATVNLHIAYSFSASEKILLSEMMDLKARLQSRDLILLNGVVQQIIGRYWTNQKNYIEARKAFAEGQAMLSKMMTQDHLILRKWLLVNETIGGNDLSKQIADWKKLKEDALGAANFETVRECDYYCGTLFNDQKTLSFCYHGTPYKSYRQRFSLLPEPAGIKLWKDQKISCTEFENQISLDDHIFSHNSNLPPKLIRNTFRALISDFYKPMTVARLFKKIYPNDYWNPHSSPLLIRQALFRLRAYLAQEADDILIKCNHGYFEIGIKGKNKNKIFSWNSEKSFENIFLEKLYSNFKNGPFTFADFQNYVDGSLRTQRRKMKELIEEGIVEKNGFTRSATYRLKS
ncbi:MAG: tetratricopeptide repeat protein [Bdellovibrio sp.]